MYEYAAKLIRVVDGDTIVLSLDLGLSVHRIETCRIAGVDTPELNSSDPAVRARAQSAKSFVEEQLAGCLLKVRTEKPYPMDKYGRYLAAVQFRISNDVEWKDLTQRLLEEGLAVPYSGGAR
jgi:micrococcal nuclease